MQNLSYVRIRDYDIETCSISKLQIYEILGSPRHVFCNRLENILMVTVQCVPTSETLS
jgi:hypothetical protein